MRMLLDDALAWHAGKVYAPDEFACVARIGSFPSILGRT
jgi:hypothetical protein